MSLANADRWRSELTPGEIARIESMLHRHMEEFGYSWRIIAGKIRRASGLLSEEAYTWGNAGLLESWDSLRGRFAIILD